jgi:hypothetical protein
MIAWFGYACGIEPDFLVAAGRRQEALQHACRTTSPERIWKSESLYSASLVALAGIVAASEHCTRRILCKRYLLPGAAGKIFGPGTFLPDGTQIGGRRIKFGWLGKSRRCVIVQLSLSA